MSLPPLSGADGDSSAIRARAGALWAAHAALALPAGPSEGGDHAHAPLAPDGLTVRGPTYLRDKVKVPAAPSLFDLMHVDMYRSADKIGNVAARKDSWLRCARAAGDTRTYLVVLYVTPATPFIHLVFFFAVQPSRVAAAPHFARLWAQFTAPGPAGDAFRNERWKVIPRIAEGPWVVQAAVGSKPALLGTKLAHSWVICAGDDGAAAGGGGAAVGSSAGPGPYIEADCDVSSSTMATAIVSVVQSSAR